MSASREKKSRLDQSASDQLSPKTFQERERQKAERRNNFLYGLIAVAVVLVLAVSLIWRSNIIARNATAVTIDGEKYSAAEVSFYYQTVYRSFLNYNSYYVNYLGLNTSASLKGQTINATAASMMGVEEGSSWHDYIMDSTVEQMTTIQRALKQAEDEGFQYPASLETQYQDNMTALKDTAAGSGLSVNAYLQRTYGSVMTEKVYGQQVLRMLRYQAYVSAYSDSLTYTDTELETAYQADRNTYDNVSWNYVVVSGAAESTTDAEGKTVDPTEEETAAAKEAAKQTADEILAAYKNGTSLESAAEGYEKATYYSTDDASYYDGVIGNWLFDSARKAGDTDVLEVGSSYYVACFLNRYRDETPTVDVRHILIMPESGTKATTDDGYEEEQTQLKDAARTEAEELLAQWKAGEATEDSFAALALANSDDGSKYNGGLYTRVTPGQMVTEFNDWCFDSSRKSGDTGVVDTSYGSHVMYYVGTDLPVWQVRRDHEPAQRGSGCVGRVHDQGCRGGAEGLRHEVRRLIIQSRKAGRLAGLFPLTWEPEERMDTRFLRNEMLWGAEGQQRLARAHVILFGLGGVGSYVAECLARAGVGELTLVDSDTVALSNLNRQLEALSSTVGQPKAEAVARRIAGHQPRGGGAPHAGALQRGAAARNFSRRAAGMTTLWTPSIWSPASWIWRRPPGAWACP